MGTSDPMNPSNQLDYALGRLDGPDRSEADAEIAGDSALADRLDRLGHSLRMLLDDGRDFEPPPGLAGRTLTLVAERSARRAILDFVPARVPFRWADVAVAAGILLAGLLTLLPAVRQTRERMNQAGCGFNLQQLGASLTNYAIRHNTFPDVRAKGPDAPVGVYALDLKDDDLLRNMGALRCPCLGRREKEDVRPDPRLMDYAYHVGFRHPSGQTSPLEPRCPSTVPLLADNPPRDASFHVLDGNSPNHNRRGQNVLFADLHVEFFRSRRISPRDNDLYLNEEHRPAPGVYPNDSVLVCPAFPINAP
jgi:prepilin-type processing-associated H-X9-DG protein